MQNLSRPLLIAMVAVLGLGGAWFAVMRPSEGGGGPAPTADAVSRAHGAVAASKEAAARAEAAAGQDARSQGQDAPAARHAAAPAAPAAVETRKRASARPARDLSTPILRELAHGKVAVLLFWDRRAADDRAARRAVAGVSRHGGNVTVHVAPVSRLGDYGAITRGIEVLQSPTVVVMAPDRSARTITGYTDVAEVNQLVDQLRAKR